MWTRLKNLWAWSALDPYDLGKETGKVVADAIEESKRVYQPGTIEFPNLTMEKFNSSDE